MDKKDKILITGGKGLIGTALTTKLKSLDYENILSLGKSDCDLMNFTETLNVFEKFKPDFVASGDGFEPRELDAIKRANCKKIRYYLLRGTK